MGAATHSGLGLGVGKAVADSEAASVVSIMAVGVGALAVGEASTGTGASVILATGVADTGPQATSSKKAPVVANIRKCRFILLGLSSTRAFIRDR